MGKIRKGILGGFSGKVGDEVGASWRGIEYKRSLPRKSSKPATRAQLDNRLKFGLVVMFLAPVRDLIKVGYQSHKRGMTPMNAAVSHALKNAVIGVAT